MNNTYGEVRSCLYSRNYNKGADIILDIKCSIEMSNMFNYGCDLTLSRSQYDHLLWLASCGINILIKQNYQKKLPFFQKSKTRIKKNAPNMYNYFRRTFSNLVVIHEIGNLGFTGDILCERVEDDILLYEARAEASRNGLFELDRIKNKMLLDDNFDRQSILSMEICGFDYNDHEVIFFVMCSGKDKNKVFSLLNHDYLGYEGAFDFFLADQFLKSFIHKYKGGFDCVFNKINTFYCNNYQQSNFEEICVLL